MVYNYNLFYGTHILSFHCIIEIFSFFLLPFEFFYFLLFLSSKQNTTVNGLEHNLIITWTYTSSGTPEINIPNRI